MITSQQRQTYFLFHKGYWDVLSAICTVLKGGGSDHLAVPHRLAS